MLKRHEALSYNGAAGVAERSKCKGSALEEGAGR